MPVTTSLSQAIRPLRSLRHSPLARPTGLTCFCPPTASRRAAPFSLPRQWSPGLCLTSLSIASTTIGLGCFRQALPQSIITERLPCRLLLPGSLSAVLLLLFQTPTRQVGETSPWLGLTPMEIAGFSGAWDLKLLTLPKMAYRAC